MSKAVANPAESRPWKLLLWTAVAGLVFGLIGFGEIIEDVLRATRNSFHQHPATGQIVFVKIDDRSLREVGNWPWPRRQEARLIDRLTDAGARKIALDINLAFPTDPADDRELASSIARSGRVVLLTRSRAGARTADQLVEDRPLPLFARHAELGLASAQYNYQNAVWRLLYGHRVQGRVVPSFAAHLADRVGPAGQDFPLDYSLDIESVPAYSAVDVIEGRVGPKQLSGKNVIFGAASDVLNDVFFLPGYGRGFGAEVQIVGAETLKRGTPVTLGWIPAFLLVLLVATLALTQRSTNLRFVTLGAAIVLLLVVIAFLEMRLIFADITPALFVLVTIVVVLGWRELRSEGVKNPVTGLPNLNALRRFHLGRKQAIVAARILNFEEALAALPPGSEADLVVQVVARLRVGDSDRVIYQGDNGIFAWFAEPQEPFGNHLEALSALFRTPARVGKFSVDLLITFGVEVGSTRLLSNRLASALVAADEAARDGLKWHYYDPETLESASWRLSMLSQLDDAIDKGEVWVAYQPKLELSTRRIIGAEALARWTHPQKGPIAASEFVAAAEQQNRIGKLTDFVLEQAIANSPQLVRKAGGNFEMGVNMSASLLTDKQFSLRLSAMLARHGLAPKHLMLELTETAALASSGEGLEMINRLRDMGVGISIDDYGTGLSTLDYLKRVPASEIKIDQSFVKGIAENRSDRLMVQSTIQLAQSLGLRVVAEGAEQREIVDLLVEMECDIAQGYAIGRQMSVESLAKRIAADRKRTAA